MNIRAFTALVLCIQLAHSVHAQTAAAGEAEAQKCEDRIATVQRDVLNKYDDSLAELQLALQKSADLEGALAVRAERERLSKEQTLSDKDFVAEPKGLRTLQTQTAGKVQDLVGQWVRDTVPKLIELKKQLTVAGKIHEALAGPGPIERFQNRYLPATPGDPGSILSAGTLAVPYGR